MQLALRAPFFLPTAKAAGFQTEGSVNMRAEGCLADWQQRPHEHALARCLRPARERRQILAQGFVAYAACDVVNPDLYEDRVELLAGVLLQIASDDLTAGIAAPACIDRSGQKGIQVPALRDT